MKTFVWCPEVKFPWFGGHKDHGLFARKELHGAVQRIRDRRAGELRFLRRFTSDEIRTWRLDQFIKDVKYD